MRLCFCLFLWFNCNLTGEITIFWDLNAINWSITNKNVRIYWPFFLAPFHSFYFSADASNNTLRSHFYHFYFVLKTTDEILAREIEILNRNSVWFRITLHLLLICVSLFSVVAGIRICSAFFRVNVHWTSSLFVFQRYELAEYAEQRRFYDWSSTNSFMTLNTSLAFIQVVYMIYFFHLRMHENCRNVSRRECQSSMNVDFCDETANYGVCMGHFIKHNMHICAFFIAVLLWSYQHSITDYEAKQAFFPSFQIDCVKHKRRQQKNRSTLVFRTLIQNHSKWHSNRCRERASTRTSTR